MGTQGPGRKRHPNREKLSAEDHALNQIAREAEARLAAKRAARAEAREIRMKELERQQKEEDSERYSHRPRRNLQVSEDDDMSVTSRSSLRIEERPDKDFAEKDSLAEVEEKYKRSMVTNAQLDNEKTSLQYQVDTLREVLLELEEELSESRRQYEDKQKECERQKHDQGVLRFQLAEMKEALEQREALLTEIRQLQQKQEINDREICDLKETIEWKDKKIGALERQKEFFDPVRGERDALREEVAHLREALKKHGITLDSDSTLNGDTPIEHHVNSDGPPDPPVRAVSMGTTEGTVERKESMSVVGECPPSGTGQDRQETAQDPQKENAEGDVPSEHNEDKNNSNTIVEIVPVDDCSHHKSETSMEEQKDDVFCDIREDEKMSEAVENISEVDGETTLKRSDVSPSGSEVFQDAIDFVEETPSTTSDEDVSGCVSNWEKEEPKTNQDENLTKTDDPCTMGGTPEEGAEDPNGNTVNICKNDESNVLRDSNASSSHEEMKVETSENITSNENIDLEPEVPGEDDLKPRQSLQQESGSQTTEESMDQNKNDAILSAAAEDSGAIDQSKIVHEPEQPSPDALLTSDDLAAQVEHVGSSSCVDTEMKSVTEDEPIKDHVIPKDDGSQNEFEHAPEDGRQGNVLLGSEDLKVEDQREEDTLSHDIVCGNIQKANDEMANKAESPKENVPPEVFSSEGESTQEDEETDDENGTIRSEKYTGESEIPCSLLGSSVDRQSMEDIRMEDASEKSPRRGKGKNKEDCVVC